MFTTVETKPARYQRAKQVIVAALLSLSLGLGMAATTAQPVGATAAPQLYPPHPPIIKGVAVDSQLSPPSTPIIEGAAVAPSLVCRITPGGWWVATQGSNTTITALPCVTN